MNDEDLRTAKDYPDRVINNWLRGGDKNEYLRLVIMDGYIGFPRLPEGLKKLHIYESNSIELLPKLPSTLIELSINDSWITEFTEFPSSLTRLYISTTWPFTSLPLLPPGLKVFSCEYTDLSTLPPLPQSLEVVNCPNNNLQVIPRLPNSLQSINFDYNPLYPIFLELYRSLRGNINELKRQVNLIHDQLNDMSHGTRARGRNLGTLQLLRPAVNSNAPGATVEAMGIPNIQSTIGSFLSGRPGTLAKQRNTLLREGPLRKRELLSRPYGAPGVGGRRKLRKTRKTRKSRKARK